jgi:hypothetical protein
MTVYVWHGDLSPKRCWIFPCIAQVHHKTTADGTFLHLSRKDGVWPYSSKIFVLFSILFVLCLSVYCLCANVYCTTATSWLPNCSLQIYRISFFRGQCYQIFFLDFYVKCTWKRPHVKYKKVILVVFVFYTLSHWRLHEFCLAKSRVTVLHTNAAAVSSMNMLTAPPEMKYDIRILCVFTFTDLKYLSALNGVKFLTCTLIR